MRPCLLAVLALSSCGQPAIAPRAGAATAPPSASRSQDPRPTPASAPTGEAARVREDHEPAAEGAAATRDDLPTRAFERCSIRELDAPGGSAESIHVALVAAREPPPGDRDEGWLVLGWRDLGAPDWRWVMRPLPEPQPWVAKGSSRELVVAQGVLVGRALILDAAPDADTIGVRVLSYSDSGPPFQYPWRGLRAEVLSWGEGPERVGDGWLFIRARGELDFEHQGRRDGFFCALVKTRLEPTPSGGDSPPSVDEASH